MVKCPKCNRKQKVQNKKCVNKDCRYDLVKAKKANRVEYWISLYIDGKQYREKSGYSLPAAKAAETKRRKEVSEGDVGDILHKQMTWLQLSEWFLNQKSVTTKKYYKTLKINVGLWNNRFGDKKIYDLKVIDVKNHQSELQEKGYSESYIDQCIKAAKLMANMAEENKYISHKTCKTLAKVKNLLKKGSNTRAKYLSKQEFDALFDCSPPHLKMLLMVGYWTGMRRGEIINMKWSQVDLKQKIISLKKEDTKDNANRTIPLSNELIIKLSHHKLNQKKSSDKDHVIQYLDEPHKGDFRDALKRACKSAGIAYGRATYNGFIFHDLRKCFITNMRLAGVDDQVIMEMSGHNSMDMHWLYSMVQQNETRNATNKLSSFLNQQQAAM